MTTQAELDRLNGKHEGDILLLARQWAAAARRDPPPSGLFLADDLDRIANGIERLRRAIDKAEAILSGVQNGGME